MKLQKYEPGYTAPSPKKAQLVDETVTIRCLSSSTRTKTYPKKKKKTLSKVSEIGAIAISGSSLLMSVKYQEAI